MGVIRNPPMPGPATRISVTIDSVMLRGLDPALRNAFADGLRTHLARVLADPAAFASLAAGSASRRTKVLRLGQVALPPGHEGARNLGVTVARAIASAGTAQPAKRSPRR